MQLHDMTAHTRVMEGRHKERLRRLQEAQQQAITSLQNHVHQQAVLVKAQYEDRLWQSEKVFQQEFQLKEQAMQRELQQWSEAMRQELQVMQQKEEAMKKSHIEAQVRKDH